MTYSIVARDTETGALGVATATGGVAVGSLVPYARAGVGAVATQGYTNPLYGFDALDALEAQEDPQALVKRLTAADPGRDRRQMIAIGKTGAAVGWSGSGLSETAGMLLDEDFAVAGNLLADDSVIPAMAKAYAGAKGPIEERMRAALGAAEAAGGDRRGILSAALKVYTDQPYPAIDVRIDWSRSPLDDLADVLDRVRDGNYAEFVAQLPRR